MDIDNVENNRGITMDLSLPAKFQEVPKNLAGKYRVKTPLF